MATTLLRSHLDAVQGPPSLPRASSGTGRALLAYREAVPR